LPEQRGLGAGFDAGAGLVRAGDPADVEKGQEALPQAREGFVGAKSPRSILEQHHATR